MGVPTVAIFGTSRPENWHPMGPRVAVVSADQLSAISVEQVLCAIPESAEARATIVDDE
jgi:ADP-heptose:LPS heptosyltransferase